jgi:tyrosine-protein kinase Etk/Wzc
MDEPERNTGPGEGEIHLVDYLIILIKHSRMIIIASAAVTVLTYLYVFCSPNIYSARASLLPPQQNLTMSAQILENMRGSLPPGSGGVSQGVGASGLAANLLGLRSPSDMYVAIMKSEPVLDRIISRFQLMKLYGTRFLEDAQKALSNNTRVMADKTNYIITIEVTCTTPTLAAEIANAFIEELDKLLQGLALQEATGRLAFVEKERLQASQNLVKAEDALRLFSEKNSVLQIDTQTRGTIEYIARLRAEIDAKEVQIQVLRYQATPRNSEMIRMETEIKGLKEKLHSAESQLDNITSDVCLPTSKAPGLGLEYLRLLRESKFQESLYQLFTRLAEVARVDMVRDVAVVQVLTPARPPEKKSNNRLRPALMAGVITFFLMSLVAFGQEHMLRMKDREDNDRLLSILKIYSQPWNDMLIRMKRIIRFKRKL